MKRLTERTPEGGYVLSDGADISVSLNKLALFEDMYDSLRGELQKITDDIERISNAQAATRKQAYVHESIRQV